MDVRWHGGILIVAVVAALFLNGCETLRAAPSKGAGFVPVQEMSKDEAIPFQKAWFKEDVDWNQYRTIYISNVNTHYLLQGNWWQKHFRRDKMESDVQDVALYMQKKYEEAFRNDPKKRFQVVNSPDGENCLTLEMAITELVPSNVVLEALGFAPYGVGTGAQVLEMVSGAESTVAFEARIKDAETGETLAMFADREHQKINPIDLKGLTWYAHAHSIIDEWAEQSVKIANMQPDEIIKPSCPFSLKPW